MDTYGCTEGHQHAHHVEHNTLPQGMRRPTKTQLRCGMACLVSFPAVHAYSCTLQGDYRTAHVNVASWQRRTYNWYSFSKTDGSSYLPPTSRGMLHKLDTLMAGDGDAVDDAAHAGTASTSTGSSQQPSMRLGEVRKGESAAACSWEEISNRAASAIRIALLWLLGAACRCDSQGVSALRHHSPEPTLIATYLWSTVELCGQN